jgi:hypothetical protein
MERHRIDAEFLRYRLHSCSQWFTDSKAVLAAIRAAGRAAVLEHKRAGNAIAVWHDGKSLVIPADQIELPDDPEF